MLRIGDLSLSRGGQTLLSGLTVDVAPGETLWLTGPNGSGKTTLLLACAGLVPPDSGTIDWSKPDPVAYSAFQGPERDGLTLGEDLAFWQSLSGDPLGLGDRLASVGLHDREATPVTGLSAGQRRRLALARLLGSGKPAWLMDEPFAGLDTDGQALVRSALRDHLERGGIALIASHQPVALPGRPARKLVLDIAA